MRIRLETFLDPAPDGETTVVTDMRAMEEARLAAYEQGYAAGWDDSASAAESDRGKLAADLGQHLQTLGFTYHEARAHLLAALEPLLLQMTATVLPAMARAGLGALVVDTLRPLAAQMTLVPVELTLHPDARPAVEQLLLMESALPVTIIEDASLGLSEAHLRLATTERRIALDTAVTSISAAVTDFFHLTSGKDQTHG